MISFGKKVAGSMGVGDFGGIQLLLVSVTMSFVVSSLSDCTMAGTSNSRALLYRSRVLNLPFAVGRY